MKKKLKLLLVIPVRGRHQYISFGIGYISSYLKKYNPGNINISLADENAGDSILEIFFRKKPDIVGISSTTPQIVRTGALVRKMRKIRKDVLIIVGGIHASILPERTLRDYPKIDVILLGEAEETINELCTAWLKKDGKLNTDSLKRIKGLAFRTKNGRIIKTLERELILDIDKIPPPDRKLFNLEYYLAPRQLIRGLPARRSTSILTSRGCPYQCKFCASNIIAKKYRTHSIPYVMKEIDELINDLSVKALFFHDDLFIANRDRVIKLCNAMIQKGYHKKMIWSCQVRVNFLDKNALPLLRKMKQAGCRQLEFGFESGSDRVLKFLKGPTVSVAQNQKAIETTRKAGLNIFGNFMIGSITETKAEIEETKKFILTNLKKIDFFQVYLTVPYPGTAVWNLCKKHNIIGNQERFENFFMYNGDNVIRSFSDTVPFSYLENVLQELNHLALKKIPLNEKVLWAINSIGKNPHLVISRAKLYVQSYLKGLRIQY